MTLAPFAAPEKPDLSPPAAASFSKVALSYTSGGGCWRRLLLRPQPESEVAQFGIILILLVFLSDALAPCAQKDAKITIRCGREELKDAAHLFGRTD